MYTLRCLEVVYRKNHFNLAKIFIIISRLFGLTANQILLQAWTEVCYQIFGTREVQTMWILQKNVYRETGFSQKQISKNWLSTGLPQETRVKKTVHGKETVLGAIVNKKKVMLRIFRDIKVPITIDFLGKCNCKQCFLSIPKAKFTLLIEWSLLV